MRRFGIPGPCTPARYPAVRNDHFRLCWLLRVHWVTWVVTPLVPVMEDLYEKQPDYIWILGFQGMGVFSIGEQRGWRFGVQRECTGWGGEDICSVKSSKAESKEQVVLLKPRMLCW